MRLFISFIVISTFCLVSQGKTIYVERQCRALGNNFRVKFADKKEYLVESRIGFSLEQDKTKEGKAGEVKLSYLGHVAFAKFVDGLKTLELFDGYSQVSGEKVVSSLSPKATKYTDDDYYRFKDIKGTVESDQDGGGLNGYLVIEKVALKTDGEKPFEAHYVFQHGDHTGGTLDYTCY